MAVSERNVEVVRRSFEALDRAFDSYWANPRSIAAGMEAGDWPEWEEALDYVHPEIEWQTVFLGETFHGRTEVARAWDDFLKWAEDYRPSLETTEILGTDRVFAEVKLVGRGKGQSSGLHLNARFYDVFTIKDGLILRLEEYATRAEALEAAQLQG
jgi:ketosteroid isomerase-like protein